MKTLRDVFADVNYRDKPDASILFWLQGQSVSQ